MQRTTDSEGRLREVGRKSKRPICQCCGGNAYKVPIGPGAPHVGAVLTAPGSGWGWGGRGRAGQADSSGSLKALIGVFPASLWEHRLKRRKHLPTPRRGRKTTCWLGMGIGKKEQGARSGVE